ncbi:NACHT domain- and WD repeat-containing protein 1-like [Diadema antillarum]|uniref:NACHT domain- and WD repeat-containing protein 1-like n=1 Tax=Diadema antillarum TaxID=105358 RepID=UPI003A8A5832
MADESLPGFSALVQGETEDLPEQESNIVRIFMSSTFTDMKEERNKLIREVFPELRRFCQTRGLEFEVVDMRWGVRDSATADHLTSALCLAEIDRCKRMSQGPYLVGFLGDKYGYRPLNANVESTTFEKLLEIMLEHADVVDAEVVDLVKKWYLKDTNAVPPVYTLQPITKHLIEYYDSTDPEKQEAARNTWWAMFDKMRKAFDEAARLATEAGIYSAEEMHPFIMSVTEEEIRHGIEGSGNISDSCLFFIREFTGLEPSFEQRGTISKFVDLVTDEEAGTTRYNELNRELMAKLKTDFIQGAVPPEALHRYTLPWSANGLDPTNCPEHATYLTEMSSVFEGRIKAMIEKRLEGRKSRGCVIPMITTLYLELLHHASFSKTKCKDFHGREEVLSSIRSYCQGNSCKPLVVHGVSGSGKTSVMAMVAKLAKQWLGKNCVVVLRFLGTSARSSSILTTIQSMFAQICFAYGEKPPHGNNLRDFSELVQVFNALIRRLPSKDKPLLLLFDSIDQLNDNNNAHKMNWLLKSLPENTFIVVSMLPKEHNCLGNIRMTLTDPMAYVAVEAIPKNTAITIIDGWLESRKRKLSQEQIDAVSAVFNKCPRPLFLKLLFEEFATWPSYKKIGDIELPGDVVEAITYLYKDLEDRHGEIFVSHALGYLTAGKSGLTETEMEDVLSCDDEVLNDVYQYWDPPVTGVVRIPSSVWKRLRYDISEFVVERQAGGKTVLAWYHRQLIETANRRYLGDAETKESRHGLLADMFLGEYSNGAIKPIRLERRHKDFPDADRQVAPQPLMYGDDVFNIRKLQELPYHLTYSKQNGNVPEGLVEHIMYNFEWILTKLRALTFINVIHDFKEYNEESALLIDAMYLCGSNLKEDPFSLAGQLIGRIADFVEMYPNLARLIHGAKSWVQQTDKPLIIPRGACLIPPGGQLKTSLAGHPSRVEAIACTTSADTLVTVCKDGSGKPMANVWDVATAELVHTLQVGGSAKASGKISLSLSHSNKHVIFGCQTLGFFELTSGECLLRLETGDDFAVSALQISSDDSVATAGSEKGTNVYVWDLNDGKLTALEHPENVRFVCFEAATELLSVCQDGFIRHWSVESKECLHSIEAHGAGEVKAFAHIKSANSIVTGGKDGIIKVCKYTEKPAAPQGLLEGHRKGISCLLALTDKLIASGSEDFSVRVWDIEQHTAVIVCHGHEGNITCLWYGPRDPDDPTGRDILVSGSKDDCLKVWDLNRSDAKCPLITTLEGHSSWISDVTGSSKQTIYTASNDKSAKVWDYRRKIVMKRERHNGHAYGLNLAPDKSTAVTSGKEDSVKFWNFSSCEVFRQEVGFVYTFLISRDGRKLIGGLKEEGVVRVWDLDQTGQSDLPFDLQEHKKGILCMALGRDDEVVTGSKDMMVKVLKLGDKSCRLTLEGHEGSVELVQTAMQGEDIFIVSGDSTGMLRIWNYDTGECLLSAKEQEIAVRCLAVCNAGCYAATGIGNTCLLWSLQGDSMGKVVKRLTVHTAEVICVAFTNDGKRIVSGSHTGQNQLHVWNFLEDDDSKDHFLEGHNHAIMDLHISDDDQYLLTASRDCTLKAWHLPTEELVASFDSKSQIKKFDMALAANDHYRIVAENKSGTILLLDLLLQDANRSDESAGDSNNGTALRNGKGKSEGSKTRMDKAGSSGESSGDQGETQKSKRKKSALCLVY